MDPEANPINLFGNKFIHFSCKIVKFKAALMGYLVSVLDPYSNCSILIETPWLAKPAGKIT
jgi:hypothetical protein